jgi:hypothetical protein
MQCWKANALKWIVAPTPIELRVTFIQRGDNLWLLRHPTAVGLSHVVVHDNRNGSLNKKLNFLVSVVYL